MPKTQEEIREAGRIRQAKFYADKANRERVLGKKTTKYEVVKQSEGKVVTRRPRNKPSDVVVEEIQPQQPEPPSPPQFRTFTQEVVKVSANKPSQPKATSTLNRVVLAQEVIQVPASLVDNKLEMTEMIKVPTNYTLEILMEDFQIFIKKQMKPADEYKFIEISLKVPVIVSASAPVPVPPQGSKPSTRSQRVKAQPIPQPVSQPVHEQIQEESNEPVEESLQSKSLDEVYKKVERLILKTNLTSAQKYANSLKTVIKVLNPKDYKDFVRMLKDEPDDSYYKLTTYEFKPNQIYQSNSLKTYVHGVIVFLTYIKTGVTEENFEKWDDEWKLLKESSKDVTAQKKLTEVVPKFDDFYQKVIDAYPEYSLQVLLVKLYQRITKRSDFYLKVVKNKKDVNDMKENYLVFDGKTATVIIQAHKTFKGDIEEHKLDEEMTNYLREYIKQKDIKYGDYLVKNKNLSDTISRMKKKLGYDKGGAINFLRQIRASEVKNNPASTPKDNLRVAKGLNHSLSSHEHYIRNHEPKK